MQAFVGCDIGKTRGENQDSVRAEHFPDGILALVCDGMGGMQGGSAASKIAVCSAETAFRAGYSENMTPEQIRILLAESAVAANRKVYDAAVHSRLRGRMGTTLVGAFLRADFCCTVNIGDSRAYRIPAQGDAVRLTSDHNAAELLFEQGAITAEERANHPRRNELTRAVGVAPRVLADVGMIPVCADEAFLLCSDGLYNPVTESRIAEIVRTYPPEKVPEQCIREANENGGPDNISVIFLTV